MVERNKDENAIVSEPTGPPAHDLHRKLVLPLAGATIGITALMVGMLYALPQPTAATGTLGSSGGPTARARPAKQLYANLCSLCHGSTGRGDGPTELERPARNFAAGAYAYGNSLANVMRTMELGIPGTAMPAFGDTMTLQERTAVASYVLAMGPKPRTVSQAAGKLSATDRPAVVQGAMVSPSTNELEPRSLLIGFPAGASIQYRSADLAAVAIYSSDDDAPFAQRTDWRGRGGSPLRALGEATWTAPSSEGPLPASFETATGEPLYAKLRSTRISAGQALLRFHLMDAAGAQRGSGTETLRCFDDDGEAVMVRSLRLSPDTHGLRRRSLDGEKIPGPSAAQTHRSAAAVLVVDPADDTSVRHLCYTDKWSASLASILID